MSGSQKAEDGSPAQNIAVFGESNNEPVAEKMNNPAAESKESRSLSGRSSGGEWSKYISVLALMISVGTFTYAQMARKAEEVRSKKKELRETVTALIDLRHEFSSRIMSIADPQIREYEGIVLNNKRLIYIESALALASQIASHVSHAEYSVLANEFQSDSNFSEAERLYKQAVSAARTDVGKVYSCRELAGFYYSPSPLRNIEKGRGYFRRAVESVGEVSDPYMSYVIGYTYEQWGIYELWCGNQKEGAQVLERAREYYDQLPESELKAQALAMLDHRVKEASTADTRWFAQAAGEN